MNYLRNTNVTNNNKEISLDTTFFIKTKRLVLSITDRTTICITNLTFLDFILLIFNIKIRLHIK